MHTPMNESPTFTPLTDTTHAAAVEQMMATLYTEDPSAHPILSANFRRTIDTLLTDPAAGRIILFTQDSTPLGYAILIPYWSNEFGGRLIMVDELFVLPAHRGQGIAKQFFAHLKSTRPMNAVGLALEATPTNTRAQKLYQSLGFHPRKNSAMICTWSDMKSSEADDGHKTAPAGAKSS